MLRYLHELVTRLTVSRVLTVLERICPDGRNLLCVELYVISEYAPYTARLRMMKRVMLKRSPSRTESRCRRNCRRTDRSSLFSSGLWRECSLSVGIRLVILAAVMGMEHLNYACHPQEIITKLHSFATVFAVASHR